MPSFRFVARDRDGRFQRGQEQAATAGAAVATLRGRGWVILDVQPVSEISTATDTLASLRPANWLRIRSVDVEVTLQQLAVMLRGGLTLLSAMRTTADQCQRSRLKLVWRSIADDVQRGKSLAESMLAHRNFPHIVVQLVRIGEQTGTLEMVLRRGAEIMERRRMLRASFITALIYPILVVCLAIGVTAVMVVNVIPKLQVFLTALGRRLPWMTQMLLDISFVVRDYGLPALYCCLALAIVTFVAYRWPPTRLKMDLGMLRTPILGYFLRLAVTALTARSLSTLLQSGVTLLDGLKTIEDLPTNRYLRRQIAQARLGVMQGGSLASSLRDPRAFLPMLPAMAAVGESAGTLDEVLSETARFLEEQFEAHIKRFSAIIEPIIILVVGGIVGFVYIAFFMALFAAAGPGR